MKQNELYPIFLKLDRLQVLIVGGGNVALEKLSFLLKSSPNANVQVVANEFNSAITQLSRKHYILLIKGKYKLHHLLDKHIVIAATNDHHINRQIYREGKENGILVNVADTPEYCDFYLGGIVTKGNVKIAISTNGKSPTTAKRLRQFFEDVVPENINDLAENLNQIRSRIKGDFSSKVTQLNELTKKLINNH